MQAESASPRHTRDLPPAAEMYRAVVERDAAYEGVFVFAVGTTGIFCRPTCPARKPNRDNVEFFSTPRAARAAGYRPCLRCEPTQPAGTSPEWIEELLHELQEDPTRPWSDEDLRAEGLDPVRVRRWFKRNHGMTFHAYQRSRRLGLALERINRGDGIMDAAFDHGYESLSGFRDAFAKLFGEPPGQGPDTRVVVSRTPSPVGPLLLAATEEGVCLVQFADPDRLESQLGQMGERFDAPLVPGSNGHLDRVRDELEEYFAGERTEFDVPLVLEGTRFQKSVWNALREIPYGETRSYADVARAIGSPAAVRAVGSANGANPVPIVIPCHRVVRTDGSLGGYGGELWRKRILLQLEGHERWAERELG